MQTLCILGRQPSIGIAELESLFGADMIQPVSIYAAFLNINPNDLPFNRLGGTVKICKVLTVINSVDSKDILKYLVNSAPGNAGMLPEGKLKIGISVYGLDIKLNKLKAIGLELKKSIRASGRSVRIIPNKEPALNSAQVLHNKLTGEFGWELVLVKDRNQTILAQTVKVQDIEAYAARDQARPKRDARVGMLPPKLAQIIINLATDKIKNAEEKTKEKQFSHENEKQKTVLDTFCGTGVILQEALLMGYEAHGTDIDPRMVEYSRDNLNWFLQKYAITQNSKILTGDATRFDWQKNFTTRLSSSTLAIATEAYLGRPFSALPKPEVLNEVMRDVDTIIKKFLRNVASQTDPGFRLCLAVPAWKIQGGKTFKHLKVLESLKELGYNRVSFAHARNEDLVYHRENQIVARELIVLKRL